MRIAVLLLLALMSGLSSAQTQDQPPQPPNGPPQQQRGERRGPAVAGTITAISGDSITVKTFDGRTATVKVTDATRYGKDMQEAKLSDFKVGDTVFVRGEKTAENTYTAVAMMSRGMAATMGMPPEQFKEKLGKEFVAGEIKAIDGLKITINRVDGQLQTITVDENTSFRKQGESVTLADLSPGDRVFARGALKDGAFVPTEVNVGVSRGMGRGDRPQGPPPDQR